MMERDCRTRRRLLYATSVLVLAFVSVAAVPARSWAARLSLQDALTRAISADFALPAGEARMLAAAAGVRQADRRVNPSLGVEIENFAGSGAFRGFDRSETTVFLQQLVEVGGKRVARVGVAEAEFQATRARAAVRVLDLLRDVEVAWVEALAATAQVRIHEERLSVARQLQTEIARRAQAGRDPAFAESRATAQVSLEQIALERARSIARTARAALASYWRGTSDFELDLKAFENTSIGPELAVVNAEVALLEAEREAAEAKVGLERSRAVPDPTIRLGVRNLAEQSDVAVVAGVSIPLMVFDTNRDNIDRALSERTAAELELESARRGVEREMSRLKGRSSANANEARRIQSEVIPQARRAVQLVREGFERGGFTYIDFSEAQRALNDAQLRRIEALKAFHLDVAAMARLTGRHARLNVSRNGKP